MSEETICMCQNVTKSYGNNRVLKDCSLEVPRGKMIGLVGENGSGKSTLIRCLLGFIKPDSGDIKIVGTIGYCPQQEIMNRVFTVREHLNFVRSIYDQNCLIKTDYLQHLVDTFRLTDYLNQMIGNLSGGTRQKVQFISSIMHQPTLLLMDEPYEGFDWEMYLAFWDIVEELRKNGTGILLITHFVYDQERFDRLYNLKDGGLHER